MTEKYAYCSTVPTTFVHDCRTFRRDLRHKLGKVVIFRFTLYAGSQRLAKRTWRRWIRNGLIASSTKILRSKLSLLASVNNSNNNNNNNF